MKYFPARVFISERNISGNIQRVKSLVDETVEVMAIVKANAYGHGLFECVQVARKNGVNWFGVAKISEALKLHELLKRGDQNGVDSTTPAHIFSWIYGPSAPFDKIVRANLAVSVSTLWEIEELANAATQLKMPARIHIKVDTGFGRNGFTSADDAFKRALNLIAQFENRGAIKCEGIWSHLAFADRLDDEIAVQKTRQQHARFEDFIAQAKSAGLNPKYRHIASSAAIINHPDLHYNMVRPGILLYGVSPNSTAIDVRKLGFKSAMRLDVQMNNVKTVNAGSGISYGHDYITSARTNIAIVPLGYADGIMRSFSGTTDRPGAPVVVDGKIVHISGRVCMDQFMLDLGRETSAKAGDWATLFGSSITIPGENAPLSSQFVEVDDWAKVANTIPYEVLTSTTANASRSWI